MIFVRVVFMKIHVVTLSNCIQFILEIKNSNSLTLLSIVLYVGVLFFGRSGLLDLIHTWNKDVGQFYEDRINEQKKLYSERLDITYCTNISSCIYCKSYVYKII